MIKRQHTLKIAIDSPAAAGAGTQAKLISKHYNLLQLDTGRVYRYIANLKINKTDKFNYKYLRKKINNLKISSLNNKKLLSDEVATIASVIAKDKKIDVIVLDHHKSDTKLPNAYAIVNPNRYDDNSKLNYLCAAGVCFVFLIALNNKLRKENWFKLNNINEPNILDFLDLVALATVCDVVPLIKLNRAIVKQGLRVLKNRTNLGLKTLYDLCNIKSKPREFI